MFAPMLTKTILTVLLQLGQPGRSPYSVVTMPECGNKTAPTCNVSEPVCDEPTLGCRAPRWSDAYGSWVRQEGKYEASQRFLTISKAISQVASEGSAEGWWQWGSDNLAYSLATIAFHESGFRRDIHEGVGDASMGDCHTIAGKRSCRSVCLMQLNIGGLKGSVDGMLGEELVGSDFESTRKCIRAGAKIFARQRSFTARRAIAEWFEPTMSGYGSGSTMWTKSAWVSNRKRTFERFKKQTRIPEYVEALIIDDEENQMDFSFLTSSIH